MIIITDKEKIYLDLKKLNAKELREVGESFIHSSEWIYPYCLIDLLNAKKTDTVLHFCRIDKDWEKAYKTGLRNKKEINLTQFKELLKQYPYPVYGRDKDSLKEKGAN